MEIEFRKLQLVENTFRRFHETKKTANSGTTTKRSIFEK